MALVVAGYCQASCLVTGAQGDEIARDLSRSASKVLVEFAVETYLYDTLAPGVR